jgi:hypothetical protein
VVQAIADLDTDPTNFNSFISGDSTVSQANQIYYANGNGTITATISNGSATDLITLNGTHAYTIAVSDTSVTAANLNTINTATSIAVNLTLVTAIGGSASDVATVYTAQTNSTVSGLGNETVTLTAGAALVSDLNIINVGTSVIVGASAVTDITGLSSEFTTLINAKNNLQISLSNTFNATLTDTCSVSQLISVDTITSGTLLANNLTDGYVSIVNGLVKDPNSVELIASIRGIITANGGIFNDTIDMSGFGTSHSVTINSGAGSDSIFGTGVSDNINGGAGTDGIVGGGGADIINGGNDNDTYIYESVSDSSIVTTDTAASGFDSVSVTTGDIFSLIYAQTPVAVNALTIPTVITLNEAMGVTGSSVLSQLDTAFTSYDNGNADIEAAVIRFGGIGDNETFLVYDMNQDSHITAADQVISITGAVTGITIVGGDIVIG